MNVERIIFKSCCGGNVYLFKINNSISANLLDLLKKEGYVESKMFTNSGILYVDNVDLTITGPFGGNKLQLKCKNKNCDQAMDALELLLKNSA